MEREETGGILVGRRTRSATGRPVVEIVDFQPVPCGHQSLYIVSHNDQSLFEEHCEALSASPAGTVAVGFYRSRYGGPIRLDHTDAALAYQLFPTPESVFLVMRESDPQSITAGFFTWETGGTLQTDCSSLEFPLNAAALSQMERPAPAPLAPPPAPRPVEHYSRAISARQENGPVPAPPRAEAPLAKRATAWSPRQYAFLGGAVVTCGALCGALGILAGLLSRPGSAPDAADSSEVLQVAQDGNDLRVTWNHNASWFRGAKSAVLSVRDGEYSRDFTVDTGLESGMLLYTPKTNDLEFRIHALVSNTERSESIRVLMKKYGKLQSAREASTGQTGQVLTLRNAPARLRSTPLVPLRRSDRARDDRAVSGLPSPVAAARARALPLPAAPADRALPPPPEVRTAAAWSPLVEPRRAAGPAAPPPAAVASESERTPNVSPTAQRPSLEESKPATPQADPNTSAYVAARPIRRASPQLLPVVRAMIPSNSSVDVTVQVGENGRVTGAAVTGANGISAESPAARLAAKAARRWKFDPATLDGHKVASQTVIHFVLKGP